MVTLPFSMATTGAGRSLQAALFGHFLFAAKTAAVTCMCGSSQIWMRRAATLAAESLVLSLLSFAHDSSQAAVPLTTRMVSGVLAPWKVTRLALSNSDALNV